MVNDTNLPSKTLKELQTLAKARGLKGYSKLTKKQLIQLLTQPSVPPVSAAPGRTKKSRPRESTKTARPPTNRTQPTVAPPRVEEKMETQVAEVVPAPSPVVDTPAGTTEQWVEQTKYALRPNGGAPSESMTDLGEDIDRLPPLDEPVVCLMSQKPGVLHAYWVLPTGEGERDDYKLRLCRLGDTGAEVFEEVAVPARVGSWYFHVSSSNNLQVQIGYYQDGRFVSARGRSVAQLPSLYASTRTDARWWISEADFMRMYLRAGGFSASGRFGWNASTSSPGGAPAPGEHLAWPGGVSSSQR